jgi:hypothetical protein
MSKAGTKSKEPFSSIENADLRDYFAGKVMIWQLSNFDEFPAPDDMAEAAYNVADAMMKARGRK